MDQCFDILNVKHPSGKGYKAPLYRSSLDDFESTKNQIQNYLETLRSYDKFGQEINVIDSIFGRGFLGFHQGLESLYGLAKQVLLHSDRPMKYLLAYRICQDHLESFFSAVRGRLGKNTKPTACQFSASFAMLVSHAEIKINGNCIIFESYQGPTNSIDLQGKPFSNIGGQNNSDLINICMNLFSDFKPVVMEEETDYEEDDCDNYDYMTLHGLFHGDLNRELQENGIGYISGFIVRVLQKQLNCNDCSNALLAEYDGGHESALKLTFLKQRGGLLTPSADVVRLCIKTNDVVEGFTKLNGIKIDQKTEKAIIQKTGQFFELDKLFPFLCDHPSVHKQELVAAIISKFIKVKKFSLVRQQNEIKKSELSKRLTHIAKYC